MNLNVTTFKIVAIKYNIKHIYISYDPPGSKIFRNKAIMWYIFK